MLFYHDVTLHHHFFEAVDESLAEILQIMIANNQMDLSIQAVEHLCPFCCTTKAKVSKVKYVIVHTDNAIPVRYHRLVHLFNVLEGTIAELYYVGIVLYLSELEML